MSKSKTKFRGSALANLLNEAIDDMVDDDMSRADIISQMADAAGIESGTVNQILNESIDCPPLDRLQGFAEVLDVTEAQLLTAAERDGCSYDDDSEERTSQKNMLTEFLSAMTRLAENFMKKLDPITRRIVEVEEWSGAASNYEDTDAYCSACLIDVNDVAGRDTKAQSHCFLPVRRPEDPADVMVNRAIFAAAGGRGITQVERPEDVPQADWDNAVEEAVREIIMGYEDMDLIAPQTIYDIADEERPEERSLFLNYDEYQKLSKKERAIGMGRIWEQVMHRIEMEDMERNQISDTWSWTWVMDIYWDQGVLYALTSRDGMLFRRNITLADDNVELGENVRVFEQVIPTVDQETRARRGGITVYRQKDGRYRGVCIASVAVLNRVGEIDSTKLYDSFIAHAQQTNQYPEITVYHLGERTRLGEADFLARDGFVYIVGFLFDDNEFGQAAARGLAADPEYWGNSIEFWPLERDMVEVAPDIKVPVYTKGENTVVTILPENVAASLFTAHTVSRKRGNMNDKIMKDIQKLLDGNPELADRFVSLVDETNESIRSRQLVARSTDNQEGEAETDVENSDSAPADATATPSEGDDESGVLVLDDVLVNRIIDGVQETEAFAQLSSSTNEVDALKVSIDELKNEINRMSKAHADALTALKTRLGSLETDEEKRKREWVEDLPRKATRRVATYRPSQSDADESSDDVQTLATHGQEVAEKALAGMPKYA